MNTTSSHLLVVSANSLLSHSLSEIARDLHWECRVFESGQEFLANFQPHRDNCLVIDLDLREISGLELLQSIRLRCWCIPNLVTQSWPATHVVVEAIKAGAGGFLEQPFSRDGLQTTVRELFERIGPVRELLHERNTRLATLTEREREVLDLLLSAATTQSIANRPGGTGVLTRVVPNLMRQRQPAGNAGRTSLDAAHLGNQSGSRPYLRRDVISEWPNAHQQARVDIPRKWPANTGEYTRATQK